MTPEARSIEEAFGGNGIKDTLQYGAAERRIAYENLNCATDRNVDFVMLGCPHNSIDQVSLIASPSAQPPTTFRPRRTIF